ncbi:protein AbiQ [Robbsia andropogonis]|uniref:type III toxin-antitoxin system ToxN/AbiQ family toxin n=1 Tax=Robbsia andropogonis TaxID=28092 RepID=UPI003D20E215
MKFYHVSDRYINFLKTFDKKVPDNYSATRPYIGVVLAVGDVIYLAPLSSPKPSHDGFKPENPTVHKLFEKKDLSKNLGIIHLNNMIPVINTEIKLVSFGSQDPFYRNLLTKQYAYIRSTQNVLMKKAEILHDAITNKKDPICKNFAQVCCDFSSLEANHLSFVPSP